MLSSTQIVLKTKTSIAFCAEHRATHSKARSASIWVILFWPRQLHNTLSLFPCLGKDTIRATAHHKWGVKELSVSSLTLIKLTREVDHKGFCRTFFSFIYLILNSDLTKKYFPQTYSTSLGLSLSIKKQCHLLIHLHTVHINHEKNNHCCLHLNYERFPRCGPPFQMTVLHL